MKLYVISGLIADAFCHALDQVADARIANAVRDWCKAQENSGNWFADDAVSAIDNALGYAEIYDVEYETMQDIVKRIEELAESKGLELPRPWHVIY